MLRRLIVLLSVALLGLAAPARAWCEASCLAPSGAQQTETGRGHCPTHEPATSGTTLSAAGIADCAVLEAVRPATARLDLIPVTAAVTPHLNRTSSSLPSSAPTRGATTVFQRCTPLRI